MPRAARIEMPDDFLGPIPASRSRLPDTFTLTFHRTPEGWRVDGTATGSGSVAMTAFTDALGNVAAQHVAAAGLPSTPPDTASRTEGAR
ncbi:MAG: hypothetical protein EOO72_00120 [Myxococcaceae bacterium]|nr:MAG: hypothetical protein EOO72_00120 [Myxococcaceae bacterium]